MEQANNTFNKGLQMDSSPLVQGNDSLSNALNATIITQNGNEIVLQNDMGNAKINRAFLPPGYEPVGVKEYGGIIYIASYNPMTGKCQIGSFPSPQRYFTENDNITTDNNIDLTFDTYIEDNIRWLKEDFKLFKITKDKLYPGDEYSVSINDDDLNALYNETKNEKGRLYNIQLGALNQYNEFVDINTENALTIQGDLSSNPETTQSDEELQQNRDQKLKTYLYKSSSPLYIRTSINHTQRINYNIYILPEYLSDNQTDTLKQFTLIISGELWYNGFPEITGPETSDDQSYFKGVKLYTQQDITELIGRLSEIDPNTIQNCNIYSVTNEYTAPSNQKINLLNASAQSDTTISICNDEDLKLALTKQNNLFSRNLNNWIWKELTPTSATCYNDGYDKDLYKVHFELKFKNKINSDRTENFDYYLVVPIIPESLANETIPLNIENNEIRKFTGNEICLKDLSSKGSINLTNIVYYYVNISTWIYSHNKKQIEVGLIKYIPPEGGPDRIDLRFDFKFYGNNNIEKSILKEGIDFETDDESIILDNTDLSFLENNRIYLVDIYLTGRDSTNQIFSGINNVLIANEFVITTAWEEFDTKNTHNISKTVEVPLEIDFQTSSEVLGYEYVQPQIVLDNKIICSRTVNIKYNISYDISINGDDSIYPNEVKTKVEMFNMQKPYSTEKGLIQYNNTYSNKNLEANNYWEAVGYNISTNSMNSEFITQMEKTTNNPETDYDHYVYYFGNNGKRYSGLYDYTIQNLFTFYKNDSNRKINTFSDQIIRCSINGSNYDNDKNVLQYIGLNGETIKEYGDNDACRYYFDNDGTLLVIPTLDESKILKWFGFDSSIQYYVFKKLNVSKTLYKALYKNKLTITPDYSVKINSSQHSIKLSNTCQIVFQEIDSKPEDIEITNLETEDPSSSLSGELKIFINDENEVKVDNNYDTSKLYELSTDELKLCKNYEIVRKDDQIILKASDEIICDPVSEFTNGTYLNEYPQRQILCDSNGKEYEPRIFMDINVASNLIKYINYNPSGIIYVEH